MIEDNKSYRKLIVWDVLKELLIVTYELVNALPKNEMYGLSAQMKRAIVSVLSNFVEGYMKKSVKEKLHFLEIAETSLLELEGQSEICLILGFWTEEEYSKFDKKRGRAAYFILKYKSAIH